MKQIKRLSLAGISLSDAACPKRGREYSRPHFCPPKFDTAACEEIVADVFTFLIQKMKASEIQVQEQTVRGLLMYWARQHGINEVRRRRRQARTWPHASKSVDSDEAFEPESDERDPLDLMLDDERSHRRQFALEAALRDFARYCGAGGREIEKAVFELRVVLGWPAKDVARRLIIDAARVYNLTHQARNWVIDRLRSHYDARGTLFASRYDTERGIDVPSRDGPGLAVLRSGIRSHLDQHQLGAYLDGDLDESAQSQADKHLRHCEGCRRALQVLADLDRRARDELEFSRNSLGALCPPPAQLECLAAGAVTEAERTALLVHIADGNCHLCQALLADGYNVGCEKLAQIVSGKLTQIKAKG